MTIYKSRFSGSLDQALALLEQFLKHRSQGPRRLRSRTDNQNTQLSFDCEQDAIHGQHQSAWCSRTYSQVRKTPERRKSEGGQWQTPPVLLEPGVADTRAIPLAQGSQLAGVANLSLS